MAVALAMGSVASIAMSRVRVGAIALAFRLTNRVSTHLVKEAAISHAVGSLSCPCIMAVFLLVFGEGNGGSERVFLVVFIVS